MPSIALRPATAADYEFAFELAREVYHELVVRQFGAWDEARHRESFEQQWTKLQTSIMIQGQVRVGVLCVEDAPYDVVLHEVQVCPSCQGQGVGTEIVRGVMDHAERRGVPLRLRVFQMSRAVQFYTRLGFLEESRTPSHLCMVFRPASPI
jgi:GNAT superfamily N-acetyltransferase